MKNIIKELQEKAEYELDQIGLTPRTDFEGTQEEHDKQHLQKALEYRKAIKILSSKFKVRDWMVAETHEFKSFDKAKSFYDETIKLCEGGETDVELYAVIEAVNNID